MEDRTQPAVTGGQPDEPDWLALGTELPRIEAVMIHGEDTELRGADFYTEALRRLFDGGVFTVRRVGDFLPYDEHMRVLEMNRRQDRANGERAEAELGKVREQYASDLAADRADLARKLRNSAARVDSKYRREGVLLAADWLDQAIAAAPQPAPELAACEADIASLTDQRNRVSDTADRLRELLDEIGVMAANAPEDGDSFGVLEDIAMRIAAAGMPDTAPLDERPDPENPVTGRTPGAVTTSDLEES